MLKMQLFAAPQINVSGSTAPSTFDTQTTGFGQLNQVIIITLYNAYLFL